MQSSTTPDSPPIHAISCAGFSAYLEAFARQQDPNGPGYRLWLVSLLGGATAVRAIWANLLDGELANIRRDDEPLGWNHALPRDSIRWHAHQVALPSEGALHLLLVPDRALAASTHTDFLLVPRPQDDVADLHYRFLQRRLRLPLHVAWARWLWQQAIDADEAIQLDGFGCQVFYCRPDEDRLARDLSAGVASGELGVPAHREAAALAA
jgi:hypothetical protein